MEIRHYFIRCHGARIGYREPGMWSALFRLTFFYLASDLKSVKKWTKKVILVLTPGQNGVLGKKTAGEFAR